MAEQKVTYLHSLTIRWLICPPELTSRLKPRNSPIPTRGLATSLFAHDPATKTICHGVQKELLTLVFWQKGQSAPSTGLSSGLESSLAVLPSTSLAEVPAQSCLHKDPEGDSPISLSPGLRASLTGSTASVSADPPQGPLTAAGELSYLHRNLLKTHASLSQHETLQPPFPQLIPKGPSLSSSPSCCT